MTTDAALLYTPADACTAITEAFDAELDDALRRDIDAFRSTHGDQARHLQACMYALFMHFISEASRHVTDERAAEQIMSQTAHKTLALAMKSLKARRGEALVPGRCALAAYHFATWAVAVESGAADPKQVDALLDELMTPIERERDEIRQTLARARYVLANIAEAALMNEGDRIRDQDDSNGNFVSLDLPLGDLRAAVRLTNGERADPVVLPPSDEVTP